MVATPPIKPADVSINVYNATSRRGLALSTSKTAAQRGFKIASVGNDPKDKTIKDVAHIRYGPEGEESAKLLAQHIKGAKLDPGQAQGRRDRPRPGDHLEGVRPGADPDDSGPDTAPVPDHHRRGLTRLRAGRGWRRAGP